MLCDLSLMHQPLGNISILIKEKKKGFKKKVVLAVCCDRGGNSLLLDWDVTSISPALCRPC